MTKCIRHKSLVFTHVYLYCTVHRHGVCCMMGIQYEMGKVKLLSHIHSLGGREIMLLDGARVEAENAHGDRILKSKDFPFA